MKRPIIITIILIAFMLSAYIPGGKARQNWVTPTYTPEPRATLTMQPTNPAQPDRVQECGEQCWTHHVLTMTAQAYPAPETVYP